MRTREAKGLVGSYLTLDVHGAECRCSEVHEQRRCLAGVEPVCDGIQSAIVGCTVFDQELDRFGVGVKS